MRRNPIGLHSTRTTVHMRWKQTIGFSTDRKGREGSAPSLPCVLEGSANRKGAILSTAVEMPVDNGENRT